MVRTAACNGHVELCSKRLDEVTLPASHNSMSSSAEEGWFSAAHTLSIGDQLRAGVRGLLIDAHYGLQAGNAVRTDLSERSEQAGNKDRELYLKTLGPEGWRRSSASATASCPARASRACSSAIASASSAPPSSRARCATSASSSSSTRTRC